MATEVQQIYLENNPYYTYTESLNRTAYILSFRYSTRESCWYFDVYNKDNTPVVLGLKLVPRFPIMKDLMLSTIEGYFYLEPVIPANINKLETDPKKIADFFRLFYIYEV